ncbi:MAG: DUF1302 domain-containing protein [Oleiphilaceae bacterium]|nr:DUF1302 domain-containing protein [Oleiphilaceae bacterium]
MTKKTQRLHSFAKLPLALAVAASVSNPAGAFQFYMGDWEANLDTTLSAGASWRAEDRDPKLVGVGNGGEGGSINSDDGNLNFDKGDTYSRIVKGSTDFLLNGGDYGAFVRAKYWYDFELRDEDQDQPLSDDGKNNASGAEILDAYVFADYWLGDTPLNLRIGKQVVSWGESTFIFNGINVINPVDVGAIRAPGAEVKEALLPVNMLYGSLGLSEDVTLEAFVQLEHEVTRIDDCGTFFSSVDYVSDGCGPVYLLNNQTEQRNEFGLNGIPTSLNRLPDVDADDTDQFGAALRWFVPELNETEFGFYFIQYHSRVPLVSGRIATDTNGDDYISTAEAIDPVTGAKYFIEYPEQIKLLGVSFNTTGPGGISLGGEFSFKKDVPVQINSPDLVSGAIARVAENTGDSSQDIVYSPVFQNRVTDSDGINGATLADAAAQGFYGSTQAGYDLYDVSQLQFTGIKFVDQFMGASRLALVGEIGGTYVHDLPSTDEIRYGRFDQTSFGLTPDYNPGDGVTALEACQGINFVGECNDDGYVTSFSWGYRARAALTYNDVFAGVNLTPQLAISHDVQGHSPGPGGNFIEGRKSVGLSVKGEYLNQYTATLGYTAYFGGEPYNPIVDRDNVALSVSYSF